MPAIQDPTGQSPTGYVDSTTGAPINPDGSPYTGAGGSYTPLTAANPIAGGSTATKVANALPIYNPLTAPSTPGQALGAMTTAQMARRSAYSSASIDSRMHETPWLSPDVAPPAWLLTNPDLASQVDKGAGYADPFFGILSDPGSQRVYMGQDPKLEATQRAAADSAAGAGDAKTPDLSDMTSYKGDLANYRAAQAGKTAAEGHFSDYGAKTESLAAVMNQPYTWSQAERQSMMQTFREHGVNVHSLDELGKAWGDFAKQAAMVFDSSGGKQLVTPLDMLSQFKSDQIAAGQFVNYQNGTSKTVTKDSVQKITDGEAWRALQDTLQKSLGRDPTQQETQQFAARMNQLAAANPGTTTTTTTADNGVASKSVTINPGFSGVSTSPFVVDQELQQQALLQAKENPDYGAYQAATTYFNAAVQALGAVGNGGNA